MGERPIIDAEFEVVHDPRALTRSSLQGRDLERAGKAPLSSEEFVEFVRSGALPPDILDRVPERAHIHWPAGWFSKLYVAVMVLTAIFTFILLS